MYPLRIVRKRLERGNLPGVLVFGDVMFSTVISQKKSNRGLLLNRIAIGLIGIIFALTSFLTVVLYIHPYNELMHKERVAEERIRNTHNLFEGMTVSEMLRGFGVTDFTVAHFADDVVVVTVTTTVDLGHLLNALDSVSGVLSFQYSVDGIQIMLLRGAL